jgi:O-acetylserine/cysteine efflux transporter
VAPLSLLIPVFGIISSMIIVGERIGSIEIVSIVVIILGLMIGFYKPKVELK